MTPVRSARVEFLFEFEPSTGPYPSACFADTAGPASYDPPIKPSPGDGPDAADPKPVGLADGALIDLGASLLKTFMRSRGWITAVLVAVLLLGAGGTAAAGGHTRGGGGNGRQGGPVRTAIQQVRENIQERRAARGCQLHTEAFPTPPAVAVVSGVVNSCSGGACPAVQVR